MGFYLVILPIDFCYLETSIFCNPFMLSSMKLRHSWVLSRILGCHIILVTEFKDIWKVWEQNCVHSFLRLQEEIQWQSILNFSIKVSFREMLYTNTKYKRSLNLIMCYDYKERKCQIEEKKKKKKVIQFALYLIFACIFSLSYIMIWS